MFRSLLFIILLLPFCVSCSVKTGSGRPVVSVGDVVLTSSDLAAVLPQANSKHDSVVLADEYVHRWVSQQVMLQKALLNISDDYGIDEAIEEYRRSLIVERYQQKLVDQKFRPVITDDDIHDYYVSMSSNFALNETIVKCIFVVLPSDSPDITTFLKSFSFKSDDDYAKIENYVFSFSKRSLMSLDKWLSLSSVRNYFPSGQQPAETSLNSNCLYKVTESGLIYLLYVSDIKKMDEVAPEDFVHDKIYSILLNKKKVDFVKQMSSDLYREALDNNVIKFYERE